MIIFLRVVGKEGGGGRAREGNVSCRVGYSDTIDVDKDGDEDCRRGQAGCQ